MKNDKKEIWKRGKKIIKNRSKVQNKTKEGLWEWRLGANS